MVGMIPGHWAFKRIISVVSAFAIIVIGSTCLLKLSQPSGHASQSASQQGISKDPYRRPPPSIPYYDYTHEQAGQAEQAKYHDTGDNLSLKSFKNSRLSYHSGMDAFRFMPNSAWRPADAYKHVHSSSNRPTMPGVDTFESKAEYLKQPLIADYAKNADKIFLMIKTGAEVLWQRLPIHLATTLTRVPYFALYADVASSVGGHEVIDILQNVTDATKQHRQFHMYRQLNELRQVHGAVNPSSTAVEGGWELDKFKNIPMLLHAYRAAPHLDWFIFMDADSYFMMDNLMDYLSTLNPNEPLYIGHPARYGDVVFNHGGSGVVLSRKAMEVSFGKHPEWGTETEHHALGVCCGDYMVAHALLKAEIKPQRGIAESYFQGESYQKMEFEPVNWCRKVISFHHLHPSDVETLWEYERLIGPERRKSIRYYDIYQDFVAPYIHKTMLQWDNFASSTVYSKQDDEEEAQNGEAETGTDENLENDGKLSEPRPWESLEACRQACEIDAKCLSWRFLPYEEYCGIDKAIRLGVPYFSWVNPKDEEDMNKADITSGFMIDRIRNFRRKTTKCDALYKANNREFQKDSYREGWYSRLQQEESEYNAFEALPDEEEEKAQYRNNVETTNARAKAQAAEYKAKKAKAKAKELELEKQRKENEQAPRLEATEA